ncbi:MAG: tetratricopeptide repeat protein [Bacteroidota bacterium]|nr:tetratricopeptide repeat protein [Bacteroidota bacterium]
MHQQTFYKVIIQGKLEFGNNRSFQMVQLQYIQRLETLYKREVLFKVPEDIFFVDDFTLMLGRFIGNATEKQWKNTVSILEYCAQFSFSGQVNAWLTDNGKIIKYCLIEPLGEKTSVVLYHEGKKKSIEKGEEKEAIRFLTEAIEKHERHSQAYEKRGYLNYHLKNYSDAIYDFKKSISFDNMNSSSHYGLGRTYMVKNDFELAIQCFEDTTKQSIALQPIYWAARRVKGQCHMELKQYDKAAFEYKLFTSRQFATEDSNFKHVSLTWFNYGKALFALGKLDEAIDAFDKSLLSNEEFLKEHKAEMLLQRGIARKAAGKSDYILDLRRAAELGLDSASKMLAEMS